MIEIPSLIRKEPNTCKNCGTQTTGNKIVRHGKRCSAGTLTSSSCTNFSTMFRAEMNYLITKKHSKSTAMVANNCKI